tara:strand:- start:398 stop:1162 length:765 start_codon:yes stop_codon:yes gene_type:complete
MNNKAKIETLDFEFNKESKIGCYIIHGFSSSTYETKYLAEFLGKNGYHTLTRNLPGHGTTAEECNTIKYQDWLSFVEQDLAVLSNKSDKIVVIGMSMGGVLALHLASLFPIECVVSAAAVFHFRDHKKLKYLNSLLCTLFPIRKKINFVKKELRKNIILHGYNNWPMIALNEFRKMNIQVKNDLQKIKCPILILHANKDQASIPINIDIIKNNVQSNIKVVKYYNYATHNIFVKSPDQMLIFNDIKLFLKGHIN